MSHMPTPDHPAEGESELSAVIRALESVVLGKRSQIELALTCLLANGHLLIEDQPGMGKTVLAHALARTLGLQFCRVQFTSDLLPGDVIGTTVFDRASGSFDFRPGPVFTQVLLADEINRATPKSQSALLEVMEERQVSMEGRTHPLPRPFFVIATQNPVEHAGTYPLPDAQLDRFLMRIGMGYPDRDAELALLAGADRREMLRDLPAALAPDRLIALQRQAAGITAAPALLDYLQAIVDHTRGSDLFARGLSTRAALALLSAARAWALLHGENRVLPVHVQAVLPAVAVHRLAGAEAALPAEQIGRALIDAVPIP